MATIDHPSFEQPANADIPVWRYMDITKLIWLLQQKAIYFTRSDQLGDPFEGHYTRPFAESRAAFIESMRSHGKEINPQIDDFDAMMGRNHDVMLKNVLQMKTRYYISCWHMNEYESAAMWKLYTSMQESVCVKTTYTKLAEALPNDVLIGKVKYIDYQKEFIDFGNTFNYVMHKRESFSHEREARAVIWTLGDESSKHTERRLSGEGLSVSVDLSLVIQKIYISPSERPPLLDVVTRLVKDNGLDIQVLQSEVNAAPAY